MPDERSPADPAQWCATKTGEQPAARAWRDCTGGQFSLSDLRPGEYEIHARAPGFAPVKRQVTVPRPGTQPLVLVLSTPCPVLEGTAFSTRWGKLEQGSVGVTLRYGPGGQRTRNEVLCTDRRGRFWLSLPGISGRLTLEFAENYSPLSVDTNIPAQLRGVELKPTGCFDLRGKVCGADDGPVAWARVVLRVEGEPAHRAVQTGRQGDYLFERVPAGVLVLSAQRQEDTSETLVLDHDGAADLLAPDLCLTGAPAPTGGGAVLIRVLDEASRRLREGVSISAHLSRADAPVPGSGGELDRHAFSSKPTAQGDYRLVNLAPGRWEISVRVSDRVPTTAQVKVVEGEAKPLDVVMRPYREPVLRLLTPPGSPLADADVRIAWSSGASVGHGESGEQLLRTDSRGLVRVRRAHPDASTVSVACWQGFCSRRAIRLGPSDNRPITIRLQAPAVVEGELIASGVRLPKRGIGIVLNRSPQAVSGYEPLGEGWGELAKQRDPVPAGDQIVVEPGNRRFRFGGVDAGRSAPYWLHLVARGAVAEPVPVTVEAGKVSRVRLVVVRPGRLRVRLVDNSGRPAAGARATFWHDLDGTHTRWRSLSADERGTCTVQDVLPGEWAISATDPRSGLSGHCKVIVKPGRTARATARLDTPVRRTRQSTPPNLAQGSKAPP